MDATNQTFFMSQISKWRPRRVIRIVVMATKSTRQIQNKPRFEKVKSKNASNRIGTG